MRQVDFPALKVLLLEFDDSVGKVPLGFTQEHDLVLRRMRPDTKYPTNTYSVVLDRFGLFKEDTDV